MTIGPLPRHFSAIPGPVDGPLTLPISAADDNGTDSDGFAQALRTIAAERFNEHGFFANAGALTELAAPTSVDAVTPVAQLAALETMAPRAISGSIEATAAPAVTGVAEHAIAPPPPTARTAAASSPTQRRVDADIGFATVVSTPPSIHIPVTVETDTAAPRARPVRAGLYPSRAIAKSAINVMLGVGDGAAAVTVSAHGMTEHQVDALRTDIVALLRRHGLVLDDLKINGRPMGQGAHDRSRN